MILKHNKQQDNLMNPALSYDAAVVGVMFRDRIHLLVVVLPKGAYIERLWLPEGNPILD